MLVTITALVNVMSSNKQTYGLNILVIEDDKASRILLEMLCNRYSCSSHSLKNGEAAILETKSNKYDLIFMDIDLPSSNGIDVMDKIIENSEFYKKIPFVPYTASVFPNDLENYTKRGMKYLLPKPFELVQLEEILDKVNSDKIMDLRQLKFFD